MNMLIQLLIAIAPQSTTLAHGSRSAVIALLNYSLADSLPEKILKNKPISKSQ